MNSLIKSYGIYSAFITDYSRGMEYPGVIFISRNYVDRPLLGSLEQIIVQKKAHQWRYGLVRIGKVKET